MIQRQVEVCRWEGVDVHPYKEDGTHFKTITRQTLFKGGEDMPVEWRYFEVGEGGHSTLERHLHTHVVMVIRGSGEVLVGEDVSPIGMHDMVKIPPFTWHQFRATQGEVLGFLCLVATERDRPQRPGEPELDELRESDAVASFIRH
jgi:mannose-6-phosphate isomerase-like protein (cupin superfamily)